MNLNVQDQQYTNVTNQQYDQDQQEIIQKDFPVNWRRWFICACGSYMNFMIAYAFIIHDPAIQQTKEFYNIQSDFSVLIFGEGGLIIYVTLGWLGIIILNKSLKWSLIIFSFICQIGLFMKCFHHIYWLSLLGNLITQLGQIIAMPSVVYIAQKWFPPQQRTLATAIPFYSSMLGLNFAFVFTSLYVSQHNDWYNANLVYALVGLPIIFFCIFVKERPPNYDYSKYRKQGLKISLIHLIRQKKNIITIVMMSIFMGINWSIFSLIQYISKQQTKVSFNKLQIGMLGISFNLGGTIYGIIFSIIIQFQIKNLRKPKYDIFFKIPIILGTISTFILGILYFFDYIHFILMIILMFIAGIGLIGYAPIALQSMVETYYPVQQLILGCIFMTGSSIFSFIANNVSTIKQIGKNGYLMMAALQLIPCLFILLRFETKYHRYNKHVIQQKLY